MRLFSLMPVLFLSISCALASPQKSILREAYIWQRDWTPTTTRAVIRAEPNFSRFVVLAAEVSWDQGSPRVALVDLPSGAISKPYALVIRINSLGRHWKQDHAKSIVRDIAKAVVERHKARNWTELQIDFDCPTSKLHLFAEWLDEIRPVLGSRTLSITILPTWMESEAFQPLIQRVDSFTLQVHSVHAPTKYDQPYDLCPIAEAKDWLKKAISFRRPFNLALPSYAYLFTYSKEGNYLGLQSEGPRKQWPVGSKQKIVSAKPAELANFVNELDTSTPPYLAGITWFRLPVPTDSLNWTLPLLLTVSSGQAEQGQAIVRLQQQGHIVDVQLTNPHPLPISLPSTIVIRSASRSIEAMDALRGYAIRETSHATRLERNIPDALSPGATITAAWIRLKTAAGEIEAEVLE